jgi:hypothetical protein
MSIYQELKKIASASNTKVASPKDEAENFVRMMTYYDGVFSTQLEAFIKTKEFKEFDTQFQDLFNIDLSREYLNAIKDLKTSEADLKKNHPRAYQLAIENDADPKAIANSVKSGIEQFNKLLDQAK